MRKRERSSEWVSLEFSVGRAASQKNPKVSRTWMSYFQYVVVTCCDKKKKKNHLPLMSAVKSPLQISLCERGFLFICLCW